jgi:hypothetical protein
LTPRRSDGEGHGEAGMTVRLAVFGAGESNDEELFYIQIPLSNAIEFAEPY